MPKQTFKIQNFYGGLNSNADRRDILEDELPDITDAMIDEIGKVRTMGSVVAHGNALVLDNTGADGSIQNGYGFFSFEHDTLGAEDAGSSENETGDKYFALNENSEIWLYSLATNDWDDDVNNANQGVIRCGRHTGLKPIYTLIDGILRISDASFGTTDSTRNIAEVLTAVETGIDMLTGTASYFSVGDYILINSEYMLITAVADTELTVVRGVFGSKSTTHGNGADVYYVNMNKWYGYIRNKFFQIASGAPQYTVSKWSLQDSHLKSFTELGTTCILFDASSASPSSTQINAANKIVLAYWKGEDGEWSGNYWIGLTPVYENGQEGAITEVYENSDEPLQLFEEVLSMQIYITHPSITSSTVASHPFGNDRIVGVNIYMRAYTSNTWFLLKKIDLIKGGNHGWATYNESTDTAKGHWGTADALTIGAPVDAASYASTTVSVTVDPAAANVFESGRKGIVRLKGFSVSPLYKSFDLNDNASQAISFNVINPGAGTANLIVEVLDENYNILQTTQSTQAFTDSGTLPPDTDSGDGGYGGSS